MILQFLIIFACLAIGELIVWLTGIKLPSCIIGMLILVLSLEMKWIRLEWVKGISSALIANMGFFFIPPGIALMQYFQIIKNDWLSILVSVIISTLIVLAVTGHVHQLTRKIISPKHKKA